MSGCLHALAQGMAPPDTTQVSPVLWVLVTPPPPPPPWSVTTDDPQRELSSGFREQRRWDRRTAAHGPLTGGTMVLNYRACTSSSSSLLLLLPLSGFSSSSSYRLGASPSPPLPLTAQRLHLLHTPPETRSGRVCKHFSSRKQPRNCVCLAVIK